MTMPPFLLLDLANGAEIAGDTRSSIVDQVVAGHGDVPEGESGDVLRFELRVEELVRLSNRVQALAMQGVETADLDEEALTVLFHDRGTEVVDVDAWPEELPPLFVIASNYAPYTERPKPEGNVVLLDAANETTFLESVVKAGVAELYVLDSDDADAEALEADFA